MHGEKLQQAKESLRQALHRLQDGDSLALVVFNDNVRCVLEPTPLNSSTRRVVESALQEIAASGMTALCGGLQLGIEKALSKQQGTNLALLLSDGQANVGDTNLETVGQHGLRARHKGITISTLGIGTNYNEVLLAEIATQGGGRFYHVQQATEISAYLTGELGELVNLAGRDVHAQINVPPGVALMPISAAYPARQEGEQVGIGVGALPADLELEILVRIIASSQLVGTKLSFNGSVSYLSPAGNLLTTTLNRVTLRITDQTAFQLRDGVVLPVVERAVAHMKASSILGISRAMSKDLQEGNRQMEAEMDHLRAYATLLGEERAKQETREVELKLNQMSAAPATAKQAVSESLAFIRSSRKFGEKDKS
jgi:Ca-activated chloride channel family protein